MPMAGVHSLTRSSDYIPGDPGLGYVGIGLEGGVQKGAPAIYVASFGVRHRQVIFPDDAFRVRTGTFQIRNSGRIESLPVENPTQGVAVSRPRGSQFHSLLCKLECLVYLVGLFG